MTQDQMDEIKRHFNVVAEGLQHEIRLIAEGRSGLVQKIDLLSAKLDEKASELDEKIGWVAESVQSAREESSARDARMEAEIRAVGDRLDSHESRIQKLERDAA